MDSPTLIPRRPDGRDYLAKNIALQFTIRKIIRKHTTINQKTLHAELRASDFPSLAEMTLQKVIGEMAASGQVIATRKGRETIYSLPSDVAMLKRFENSLTSSIEIRRHVYEVMVKHYQGGKYPAISKARYLEGNLKFLLNDLGRLMVLEALKGNKGLHKEMEDVLRGTLKDMLSLAANDKEHKDVLPIVISSLLDPKNLLGSRQFMEVLQE